MKDWENPGLTGRKKLEPRCGLIPYADEESALRGKPRESPYYLSLNGEWKFRLFDSPEMTGDEFLSEKFDDSSWDSLEVPSCWQMKGYGYPHYTNSQFPFPKDSPYVPGENDTGCYRKTVHIDPSWKGRRIILRFDGVDSCFYLRVNGRDAGFSKGSRLPAEFDVTGLTRPGPNVIAVKVLRWSDGSYLEDQDMWWLSGIFRNVHIKAEGAVFLEDAFARAGLSDDYRDGVFEADIRLKNTGRRDAECSLIMKLRDRSGRTVLEDRKKAGISSGGVSELRFQGEVKSPRRWTAETPELYEAVFTVEDEDGIVLEAKALRAGFRRVELKNGSMLVNGKAVMLIENLATGTGRTGSGHMIGLISCGCF